MSIHDNLHLLRNIIEYVNNKNIKCAFIGIDQTKYFEKVSHKFMLQVLVIWFWGYICPTDQIIIHAYFFMYSTKKKLSYVFNVTRSVRQGCGLSPLLYVLCIEPFALKSRLNPHILGLKLPTSHIECKISQYADDSTLIDTDYHSIDKALHSAELYGSDSGAKINRQKSNGLWLGAWKNNPRTPANLNWTSGSRKLMVYFWGMETIQHITVIYYTVHFVSP